MDKPISVGDLVMVVRGHACLLNDFGGSPFVVTALLHPTGGGWRCLRCNKDSVGPNEVWACGLTRNLSAVPLSWLKRIPPMEELEGERTDEKFKEPA